MQSMITQLSREYASTLSKSALAEIHQWATVAEEACRAHVKEAKENGDSDKVFMYNTDAADWATFADKLLWAAEFAS